MIKTFRATINVLISVLLMGLLFVNYVIIESGLEPHSGSSNDGQSIIGIASFAIAVVVGIACAFSLLLVVLIKKGLSDNLTYFDISLIVFGVLFLVFDLYICFKL